MRACRGEVSALREADASKPRVRCDVVFGSFLRVLGLPNNDHRFKRLNKLEEGMTFIVSGSIAFSQKNEVTLKSSSFASLT